MIKKAIFDWKVRKKHELRRIIRTLPRLGTDRRN
mgnify:CR=1 FL=1